MHSYLGVVMQYRSMLSNAGFWLGSARRTRDCWTCGQRAPGRMDIKLIAQVACSILALLATHGTCQGEPMQSVLCIPGICQLAIVCSSIAALQTALIALRPIKHALRDH